MTNATECAAFEAVLPDYLDGTLADDGAAGAQARAHIVSCESCRALVRDMERIRARAASLPTLQPSRDLWAGIEARIQSMPQDATPVRPITTTMDEPALVRRAARPRRRARDRDRQRHALRQSPLVQHLRATRLAVYSRHGGGHERGPRSPGSPRSPTPPPPARPSSSDDQQISAMRQILDSRRSRLNPKTVAIIEKNLRVIDTAIAESRAALARDPANRFLAGQLDASLNTKLELLRTVAMLPSRT